MPVNYSILELNPPYICDKDECMLCEMLCEADVEMIHLIDWDDIADNVMDYVMSDRQMEGR